MMKLSHHSLAFAGLATLVQAAKHELVVGTFVSKNLYTLSFDDQAFTLDLVANISVPVPSSWIALSVSVDLPATMPRLQTEYSHNSPARQETSLRHRL